MVTLFVNVECFKNLFTKKTKNFETKHEKFNR